MHYARHAIGGNRRRALLDAGFVGTSAEAAAAGVQFLVQHVGGVEASTGIASTLGTAHVRVDGPRQVQHWRTFTRHAAKDCRFGVVTSQGTARQETATKHSKLSNHETNRSRCLSMCDCCHVSAHTRPFCVPWLGAVLACVDALAHVWPFIMGGSTIVSAVCVVWLAVAAATPALGVAVGRNVTVTVASASAGDVDALLSHATGSWASAVSTNATVEALVVSVSPSGADVPSCGALPSTACRTVTYALAHALPICTPTHAVWVELASFTDMCVLAAGSLAPRCILAWLLHLVLSLTPCMQSCAGCVA